MDDPAKPALRALFFGRHGDPSSAEGLAHLQRLGFETTPIISRGRGEGLPPEAMQWRGDFIFCYRSLFVLPPALLERARLAPINFHPAPPEFPGSGCVNFALYEGAPSYGVTAHVMNERVDNGTILAVRRFPIEPGDDVASLLERTHAALFALFREVTSGIARDGTRYLDALRRDAASERWRGTARRIRELEALQTIDPSISREELDRIVRATYTEAFPPRIVLHGHEFVLRRPPKR